MGVLRMPLAGMCMNRTGHLSLQNLKTFAFSGLFIL